jgi:ABC-type Na+ efflux pump permease subunit
MFIALLISHDAIVGEMERGTMLLLLSYPVGRWQVLIGKFVGISAFSPSQPCWATAPRHSLWRSRAPRSIGKAGWPSRR